MNPGCPSTTRRRWTLLWLGLILAAGLAARFLYFDWRLDGQRFWDERFSFANVLQVLETGTLKPENGYYPLLSYLPQTLLLGASDWLARTTGIESLAVRDGHRFTPHAYLLARLVQAVWGVLAVWLTFLIGRRLFSDAVGLVAAAAVAFSPWMIHASGIFKPDAPLVLAVLLAFLWSLAAAERPTAGRYALAGGGVALAMSCKLTGGLAAVPLIFVSALRGRREPRRAAQLALAGVVALVLFLVINPYWPTYLTYLEKVSDEYDWKAARKGMTRWQAPLLIAKLAAEGLGVLATAAAAIAALALAALLVRRRLGSGRPPAAGAAMLLFFPPAYAAAYVAKTAQFKPNNFLPILPFIAVIAAWGLVAAIGWLAGRLAPRGRQPAVVAIGIAALAVFFAERGTNYVYRAITPSGQDLALRYVDRWLRGYPKCQVVHERLQQRWPLWELAAPLRSCLVLPVDRLTDMDPAALRLTDAVVFPQSRLAGPAAAPYVDALSATRHLRNVVFGAHWPRVRGPGFVAALAPWSRKAPERELALAERDEGRFRPQAVMPPEVEAGDVVSFSVWLPRWALADDLPPPRLRMGGYIVDLILARLDESGATYLSPRLVDRQPAPHARLNRRRLSVDDEEIRLTLWRWQR